MVCKQTDDMPNPYILLAFVLAFAGTNWWSYHHGIDVAEGEQAERELTIANAYLEAGRRNAAFESAESLRKAKAAAARRAADREATHKLELELAKDEAARTCRIGAGSLGVLQRSIRDANAIAAPTSGVDGTVRPAEGTADRDSGGTGAGATGRGAAVRGGVPAGSEPR